ncbi:hypothetical protein [Marinobacter sp.]|uniref:hypothetical protein n=1 Tax=Marinobacter sp. TaxID=50741 RepID=UPI0035C77CC2
MGPLGSLTSVTGGGGLQGGAGISETGDQSRAGGNTFNFAPPSFQVMAGQQQDTFKTLALVIGAVGLAWAFSRK